MQDPTACKQVFLKYFENRPNYERTSNYDVVRHWIDCNKNVVAFVEDENGKEIESGCITKIRISVPKAYIFTNKEVFELKRRSSKSRVTFNPSFVIEDDKGNFKGDFKTLEEAQLLVNAGRKVRGKYNEEDAKTCVVWTAPIKAVYLDAKMFETVTGIKYFISE